MGGTKEQEAMKVVEVSSIAPSSESQELPTEASFALTFFDILWLRLPPVQRVFFYQFHHPSNVFYDTLLPKLKHSLSLALGHFFPLAGHLTWPTHSTKPTIVYNQGDTLSLTVAESEADFNHLAGTDLSEATEIHHLVPPLTISHEQTTLFALQVTLFPNSGFSIGVTSHHAVLDGKASTTFFKSWAYLCRESQPPFSLPAEWSPVFDREIVKDPTRIGEKFSRGWLRLGGPNNRSLMVNNMPVPEDATRGLFQLSRSDIEKLRQIVERKENNTNLQLSTFVLAAAYAMVCRVKAEGAESQKIGFGLNIDCRSQLEPPVPPTYLGNCVGIAVPVTETSEIMGEDGLVVAVKAVSECLGKLKKDGFLSKAENWWKMVYESYEMGDTKTAAFAGSPRFEVYSCDFGWGKPTKVYKRSCQTKFLTFFAVAAPSLEVTVRGFCTRAAPLDFTQIQINRLPTVVILGRPNVGKSALFNRLIRRREALVYNTPDDHVTRDIREGIAKLGDLRFRVLDSAGLEAEASSGSILHRTASMTANVLARSNFALFLTDARAGVHPLDLEVGKWLRKHAPQIKPIVAMNKSESLFDANDSLATAANEICRLGFGGPIAISAETGLGMHELYVSLRPLLEDYMLRVLNDEGDHENSHDEDSSNLDVDKSKLPLQLAIVGRPNVGKSTLLNALLQEERVLVGPEAGLTRDAIRTQFEFQGRTIYLVDTAGWLQRTKQEKGAASLSIMQSRKSLLRAHIIALVLDAEEIVNAKRSMKHAEVVIARRAVEEGRGLVVIVNKMDLLRGKHKSLSYEKVMEAVPQEIQTIIPQITGIPVVFISALEGRGRSTVLNQVIDTYEKWCSRLPTARLNRWLQKVMSRHSWKDQAAQPKVKYFTQVKARPPTFVAFVRGKTQLSQTDIRFLTKSLKEDFDLGGIPIRIMQRSVTKKDTSETSKNSHSVGRVVAERIVSDKRSILAE